MIPGWGNSWGASWSGAAWGAGTGYNPPGYYGLLDFTGIPVGVPTVFAPSGHGGFRGAGKRVHRLLNSMQMEEQWRLLRKLTSKTDVMRQEEEWAAQVTKKKITAELEIARRQAMLSSATYTLLLSEV